MNNSPALFDVERVSAEEKMAGQNNRFAEKRLRKKMSIAMRVKIAFFFLVLGAGCILSLIVPLRPTVSQIEKRDLAEFPKFTMGALFSGNYFEDIDTWFADTFPGREQMIKTYSSVKSIVIGNRSVQVQGTVEQGDEIPDAPSKDAGKVTSTPAASSSPSPSATEEPKKTPPPIGAVGDTQSFDAVLLSGNSAFEYYNFDQAVADKYISVISTAATELKGKANVYDMVVPNSMGIMIPDDLRDSVNSSDQSKAIDYMYGSMNGDVKTVSVYDTLMNHRDEYIYFRTDHHWTALGAYYAYDMFTDVAGIEEIPLSRYKTIDFPGFLGTFYSSTQQNAALAANPDTVTAYLPFNNNTLTYTNSDGQQVQWDVVKDVTDWDASYKYNTFIGGDNPFVEITNTDRHDGSSIVVVKESYGNAFVPFLVANYEKVYVVDYRYWSGDLSDFVAQNGVKDVLFLNNISMTRNETLVGYIEGII